MLEWIDLPDTDGMYQVSNHGDVRSNHSGTPRIMKQNPGTDGRLRLNLQINGIKKQFNTNKLVAICFLNHIPCGHRLVVNHIDFNYLNNHVSNLEIVTQRQNANQKHLKKGKTYSSIDCDEKLNCRVGNPEENSNFNWEMCPAYHQYVQ